MKRQLKAKAHSLHPIVMIGAKGLTEPVIQETDNALSVHELIKIKVSADNRQDKITMVQTICDRLKADCVSIIGHIAILYRLKEK